MNKILIILALIIYNSVFGQNTNVTSKQLSEAEIDSMITDSIRNKLQIDYGIYRVYEYDDLAGKHFIVMTENRTECEGKRECFDSIKTNCYSFKNNTYKLEWALKDFILPNSYEYSISHWTKYFEIKDYDGDGFADPIIIYGTFGMNETDDGRIKILTYYKGRKIAIRHQNGVHDNERYTQVDKQFYQLPIEIQNRVKIIMENINENDHGIFPSGWGKAMENKELEFDEY